MPRPRKNCLPKVDSPSKNTRQKKAQTTENVAPNIKSPNAKIKQINNNQDKSPNSNNTYKLDTPSKLISPNRKKAIIKTYQAVHRKSKAEHEMSSNQSKAGDHLSPKPMDRTPLNSPSTDINTEGLQILSTDKKLTKKLHVENYGESEPNTPIGNTKKRKQPPRNAKTPPKKDVPTKKARMGQSKLKIDESNTNEGNMLNVRQSELNLTELEIDERKISNPVKSTSTKQMEYNNSSKVTKNHQTYNTKKKVINSVKPIISKQKHQNSPTNEEPSCNKEAEKESLSKNDDRNISPKEIDMAITKRRDNKKTANTVNIKNLPNSKNKPLSKTTKVKDVSVTESEDKSLPLLAIDVAETSRTEYSNSKKKTPPCAKITSPKKVTASNKSQKLSPNSAKRKKSPQKPAIKNTKKNKNKMIDQYDTQEETKEKDNESVMRVEHEYIADGFKDDCELFIRKCQCVSQLNFEKFCMIWKSMEFAHLYRGRQSGAEIAELSEELIFVAKSYMIATDRTFEVNVAGLFLVYALLNLQPYKSFAALRLVPNDVEAILALESEARRQRRLDIIYILGHVLIVGPCQFHVLVRECALENPIRKYFDGSVVPTDASTLPIGVLSNNNEALSLIKTVTTLDHKYSEAKRKLQERFGADSSLNFASNTGEELQETIQDVLPELMTLQHRIANKIKHQSYEVERQDTLKSIKDKAMGNVVNTIKFLTGVNDRKNIQSPPSPVIRPKNKKKHASRHSAKSLIKVFGCSDESNKNNPDLTGTTSKNLLDTEEQNEACPLRKTTSSQDSPRQRKTDSISPSKAKRKSKHIIRNSFDNDSFETSTDINTDTEDGNDKTNDSTDTPNRSNNMNMPLLAMNEAETPTTDPKDTNSRNEVIKEINSERTIVPAIVHDGGDARRVIEVEIIDDLNKPNDVLDCIRHKSIDSSVGEEIDEHLDSEDSSITPLSGLFVNQRQILSKDKRGFKRTHVRSKFKKQGLLTVANFENSHEDDLIESNLE